MKFLKDITSTNVMLCNTIYHRPMKHENGKYVDYLDIVYKDLDTGKKYVKTIAEPEMDIYVTKPEFRDYYHNRTYIEIDKTEEVRVKYKDIELEIANIAGEEEKKFVYECFKTGRRRQARQMQLYPYVFGSDYSIDSWYKMQFLLNYHSESPKPLDVAYLDIEVDSIDIRGFPSSGSCPINAVTLVHATTNTSYTFLLRNNKNPQIQQFEDNISEFIVELSDDFDGVYGKMNYRFFMYDDELLMITDIFKLINSLKMDFLFIWNMSFDIPFFIDRIEALGGDAIDIMCSKDFPVRNLYFVKDTKHFKVESKGDYFFISSYTAYLDQMIVYAALRKGMSESRSHRLSYIAEKEIGDAKLDFSEDANIKTLAYVDYKKFVKYNIKDTLLQLGVGNKTKDAESLYNRAYMNATPYERIFRQTAFIENRAYLEFIKQGVIIGNNVNAITCDEVSEDDIDNFVLQGAVVGDPLLNSHVGVKILGKRSKYVFDNSVDADLKNGPFKWRHLNKNSFNCGDILRALTTKLAS